MTTPDFPMPYVVQFQAKTEGGRGFTIPLAHQVNGSAVNHYLGPGTYQIQVTWDGSQEVQITYSRGRFWVLESAIEARQDGANNRAARLSKMFMVTVPEGFGEMVIRLVIPPTSPPISASNIEQNNTATMMVYPSLSQGEAIA